MNGPTRAAAGASWSERSDAHTDVHDSDNQECVGEPHIVLLTRYPLLDVDVDVGEELLVPDHLTGVLYRDAGGTEPRIMISHNDTAVFDLTLADAARLAADLRTLAEQAQS